MYTMAGAASKSQERIRQIARDDYNATARGLSGVSLFAPSRYSHTDTMVCRTKIVVK